MKSIAGLVTVEFDRLRAGTINMVEERSLPIDPLRVFSRVDSETRLRADIDQRLTRMAKRTGAKVDDVELESEMEAYALDSLIGALALLRVVLRLKRGQ